MIASGMLAMSEDPARQILIATDFSQHGKSASRRRGAERRLGGDRHRAGGLSHEKGMCFEDGDRGRVRVMG
jgi:hypothetical protein